MTMSSARWHLYLIRTANGMLYTGITTDVQRRLGQHQRGGGAKSLRGKGPLTLVFQSPAGDRSRALRWEYRVKQLSRAQKEHFVALQEQALDHFGLLRCEDALPAREENPRVRAVTLQTSQAEPATAKAAQTLQTSKAEPTAAKAAQTLQTSKAEPTAAKTAQPGC